jgi:tetratricopeptide (TPR) repeat protein
MRTSTRRPRPVTDDSELATQIGGRLKQARLRSGLTQQQLAGERYTKAYVSALENGLVRPSMAALSFFSAQLGVPPSHLIGDDTPAWSRLEADIHLAAGRWREAIDGYTELLSAPTDIGLRAELLRGRAEASCRLDDPLAAVADAAEAIRVFTSLGRRADAALATYWLSYAQAKQDNFAEARSLLRGVLEDVRGGLAVEPDFSIRLLIALATVETHDGDHAKALAYLHEVRAIEAELDDRRRATYLYDLAHAYRETGDYEAAIRTGYQSLALYQASGAEFEMGAQENSLALAFLANGNTGKASELLASAQDRFERLHDERWRAHVLDTAAQIALAGGDPRGAQRLTGEAMEIAEQTQNVRALVSALITQARAQVALGKTEEADRTFERAADLAREARLRGVLRELLGQWAETLARAGQHERAYALTREALTAS